MSAADITSLDSGRRDSTEHSAEALTEQPVEQPAALGLDIGGTSIEALAMTPDGEIVAHLSVPTVRGPDGVLDSARAAVDLVREHLRTTRAAARITAIGVGVPGVVDTATGTVDNAVNLSIGSMDLGGRLEAAIGLPVTVGNDVTVAALGAARHLGGLEDLAFINIGTGLAAGIILDGRIRTGSRGAAGEIGHLAIDENHFACPCGQRGCLETVASGSALHRVWDPAEREPDVDLAQSLLSARAAGDAVAGVVFDRFARGVAHAVRVLCLTVDAETIVIGGGMSALGQGLLDAVAGELETWAATSAFLSSLEMPARLRLLPQGTPVGAIGAALLPTSAVALAR